MTTTDDAMLIWAGRRSEDVPGVDDWTCGRVDLLDRLDRAEALVVLDALSFPWDFLGNDERDVPVGLVVPRELDGTSIGQVFGQVALRHLGPQDRLVELRADVRRDLSAAFGLPANVWVDVDPEAPDIASRLAVDLHGARRAKSRWRRSRDVISLEVRRAQDGMPHWRDVLVVGDDPDMAPLLGPWMDAHIDGLDWNQLLDGPAPPTETHGVVVITSPDAIDPNGREAALRAAVGSVRVGGRLVVHATVVAEPDAPEEESPPSMDALLDLLETASGQLLHVEEIRSLRYTGEPFRRGVIMSFTRLGTSKAW